MNDRYVAYAGTYTHESSKGIHIYDMDVEKGRITERCEVTIDNPSSAISPKEPSALICITVILPS